MFGLDEAIANLSGGASVLVVVLVAALLGLRHATDDEALMLLDVGLGDRGGAAALAGTEATVGLVAVGGVEELRRHADANTRIRRALAKPGRQAGERGHRHRPRGRPPRRLLHGGRAFGLVGRSRSRGPSLVRSTRSRRLTLESRAVPTAAGAMTSLVPALTRTPRPPAACRCRSNATSASIAVP